MHETSTLPIGSSCNQLNDCSKLASLKNGLTNSFMVSIIDTEGCIIYTNEKFLEKSKWTPKRILTKTFWNMFPSEANNVAANIIFEELTIGNTWNGQVEKMSKEGDIFWVHLTAIPIKNDENENINFIILEKDETEHHLLKEHLEQIAYIDPETNLINRHRLEMIVNRQIEEKKNFSLVYVDIDQYNSLRSLHDTFGNNSLLNEFIKRLNDYFKDCTIARVDESEFIILSLVGDWFTQGFLSYLKQHPIYIKNKPVAISISGGTARFPEDQLNFHHLVQAAESTLLKVRQEGGNKIVTLSHKDHLAISRQTLVEIRLIEALKKENLHVVFQAQKNLHTNKIETFETFIRWEDEKLGVISPNELIPIAENTGMIQDIGLFVLEQACKQAVHWKNNGKNYKVSINTSLHEFKNKSIDKIILQTLEQTGCPPELIQIEINESFAFEAESETTICNQMKRLSTAGIRFILDDFGTGQGSFRYLQLLPISQVKIDQSFIAKMVQGEKSRQLVQGMIQLVQSMGIEAVAEGVETSEQLEMLLEMKCDLVQGYLIGKPLQSSEL